MEFEPVIGFEIHAELKTRSKVFCGCRVDFGLPPNTSVCPVCLGMPGSLPVLNRQAVELVMRTAMATQCEITRNASFDRKNYYYPDIPKNYQISEQYAIIGVNGYLDFACGDTMRRCRINNIHLEEDAGKNIHPETPGADYSLVDLNRAGMALMEIVTEPDLRSLEEAEAFMKAMRSLLEYTDVSDCKMQEGSLRFELNVSVRPMGSDQLNPAYVEVKNVASMRTVLQAGAYEIKRQSKVYRSGGQMHKETRLWDDVRKATRAMRSKEGAMDYRYFPDPDLVELDLTPEWQEQVRRSLPELQPAREARFVEQYAIPLYDAAVLTQNPAVADYFEAVIAAHNNPKAAANWMMTEVLRVLNEQGLTPEELKMGPDHLGRLIALIDAGTISGAIAKQIFPVVLETGADPMSIVEEKGLVQISDTGELEALVDQVMAEHPSVCDDFRAGKQKALGRLVGAVMKATQGKANPQMVNALLTRKLAS